MKIGLVIYGSLDTVSGGYLYDRKLVEYLRAQGDMVEIISLPWRKYSAHLTDNFRFRLPTGLDLVIEDELNHPSLIAANAGRHPYPIISLVHHLRSSEMRPKWQNALYRIVEQKYLQSVDGFIFNSQTTKSVVTKLLNRREPSVVAYPPTERFGSLSEEEISARSNDPQFRILFLGNVIYRKGLHTLLEALNSLVRDNISHYSLDVVGSLNAEPKYVYESERYVLTHGLSSHVKFHSSVDDGTLAIFLRRAHILVVPSSYEGFGIVYLEGMGFGLPAIGTTAGAANEIITHGENGYLIEPEDEISLAHHIKELAEDRDLLLKSSLNALQRYKSQPKWDDEARKIREFLQRMIS